MAGQVINIGNLTALSQAAEDLGRQWRDLAGQKAAAVVICLTGELGAGKTAFVKALARSLGIKGEVMSPTFILHQAYDFPARDGRLAGTLHHLDTYRLKAPQAAFLDLGFQDLIKEPRAIICIEWGERVAELLPEGYIAVKFKVLDNNRREVAVCEAKTKK